MADFITLDRDIQKDVDFWDTKREIRLPAYTSGAIKFDKVFICGEYKLSKDYRNQKISVIFSEHEADLGIEEILSQVFIEEQKSYDYRGWKVNRVTGIIK